MWTQWLVTYFPTKIWVLHPSISPAQPGEIPMLNFCALNEATEQHKITWPCRIPKVKQKTAAERNDFQWYLNQSSQLLPTTFTILLEPLTQSLPLPILLTDELASNFTENIMKQSKGSSFTFPRLPLPASYHSPLPCKLLNIDSIHWCYFLTLGSALNLSK